MKKHFTENIRKAVGRFSSHFTSNALILMYHRVAEVDSDPWLLCVKPQNFAEQLEVLQRNARPLRLQELIEALQAGDIPRRSVVVTFDDGYADNLHDVKPLLERYGIPATIFLATGYIGQGREFWWDELESLLLQPSTLPASLRLSIAGEIHQWHLGEAATYAPQRERNWRPWRNAFSQRHLLYFSLWKLLHPLSEMQRRRTLDELLAWADTEPVCRSSHRTLSPQEVLALAQGNLIDIGAHTVTHSSLAALSPTVQRNEIRESKARLEEILDRPVTSFAYPYGQQHDYTAETISIVQEGGFACACSAFAGVVRRDSNRFQLPRMHVQNWDGQEFARRLSLGFSG